MKTITKIKEQDPATHPQISRRPTGLRHTIDLSATEITDMSHTDLQPITFSLSKGWNKISFFSRVVIKIFSFV